MKKRLPIIMYASGEADSDMYYATKFLAPDPFLFLDDGLSRTIFVSELEYSRARLESACKVIALKERKPVTGKSGKKIKPHPVARILLEKKIREVTVPYNFPSGLAAIIEENGITARPKRTRQFFGQREVKTSREIRWIKKSQEIAQQAVELAIAIIGKSKADGAGRLQSGGKALTSEMVQSRISQFLAAQGFDPSSPIVSCGKQSAIPHELGHGALAEGRPIIIDVFPRHLKTRYWGDVTRTVVKGEPQKKFVKMYEAVKKAQQSALDKLGPGVTGGEIHGCVKNSFHNAGFENQTTKSGEYGFIHGTGHGVGLDIHEQPRLATGGAELKAGNAVTVEPGLYYPDVGGARIEDLVVITKSGYENLTRLGKELRLL